MAVFPCSISYNFLSSSSPAGRNFRTVANPQKVNDKCLKIVQIDKAAF